METDFEASLSPVRCLAGEIDQVILNLVVNAAHTIDDANKKLRRDKGAIHVSTRRDGDFAEIRVADVFDVFVE